MTRLAMILAALLLAGMRTLACAAGFQDEDFAPPNIPKPAFPDKTFEVRQFGARGDGKTNDTRAITAAIEKCNAEGGGTVHFPSGKYMAASIHLKSNVRLALDDGAIIEGLKEGYDKPEPNPFSKFQDAGHSHYHNSLMWGENIENFAIIGGQVNGGGATQSDKTGESGGNKVIAIKVGKNLCFQNVTHVTGAHFVYLLNDCENITFDHLTIKKSRDAIDLMGCRNVAAFGCRFTGCSDDTLGIKSDYALGRRIRSENIYAWDDYFESGCNGLQFGSETAGDFKHIRCWNIQIGQAMKAGIGITCNDSATIEDVRYRHIEISHAANPIFMLITNRLRTGEAGVHPGVIKDVLIEDVTIKDAKAGRQGPVNPMTICGLAGHPVENVTLDNVKIEQPAAAPAPTPTSFRPSRRCPATATPPPTSARARRA